MNYLEIMLRKKLVNKTIISPYYLANTFLGLYIKKRYKNKIQINHSKFLDILDKRLMDTSLNYEEINNKDSIYQLSFSEYKKPKNKINFEFRVDKKLQNDLIFKIRYKR